jgi:hypothetical protein
MRSRALTAVIDSIKRKGLALKNARFSLDRRLSTTRKHELIQCWDGGQKSEPRRLNLDKPSHRKRLTSILKVSN